MEIDLIRLYLTENLGIAVVVSAWLAAALTVGLVILGCRWWTQRRFAVVELDISLGGIGSAKIKPTRGDLAIAHKIWTELVTRKAAITFDAEHDLIAEVYDSWYSLFGRVRELIGGIPAELVRRHEGTRQLVRIAIDSLNLGLRPHLTRWQGRFRNWWRQQGQALETRSPQDVQRDYPEFQELMEDLLVVNQQLRAYAAELKKLVDGP